MSALRRGIARDFALNILASALLTGVTQLFVYPGLSRMVQPGEYGALLTTMAIVNVIGASLGGSLNNTRILLQGEYDRQGAVGDYNRIFLALVAMAVPLTVVVLAVGGLAMGADLVGSAVTAVLVLWRAYYSASYRIRIDYRKNLLSSVISVVGYGLGLALARMTGQWTLAFITGEFFACAYIAFTGHIVREGTGRTDLMGHTLRKYTLLFSGAALGSLSLYMDRLLVYPMLGGTEVSTYTVASFLGKSAGLLMGPIAGVLLTYYAKAATLSRGQFVRQVGAMVVTATSAYALILLVGKPITIALYPTIAASAMPYFAVANLASIAFVAGSMIHPSVLRFCDLKWQPAIQGAYLISYVVLGALGTHFFALWGLCWAVLAANTLRGVVMIGLVLHELGSERRVPPGDAAIRGPRDEQVLPGQTPVL